MPEPFWKAATVGIVIFCPPVEAIIWPLYEKEVVGAQPAEAVGPSPPGQPVGQLGANYPRKKD